MNFEKDKCVSLKDSYKGQTDKCLKSPKLKTKLIGIITSVKDEKVTVMVEEALCEYIKDDLTIVECSEEIKKARELIMTMDNVIAVLNKYIKCTDGLSRKLGAEKATALAKASEEKKYTKAERAQFTINADVFNSVWVKITDFMKTSCRTDLDTAKKFHILHKGKGSFSKTIKGEYVNHITKLRAHVQNIFTTIPTIVKTARETYPELLGALLASFTLTCVTGGRKSRKQRNNRRRRTLKTSRSRR